MRTSEERWIWARLDLRRQHLYQLNRTIVGNPLGWIFTGDGKLTIEWDHTPTPCLAVKELIIIRGPYARR